MNCCQEAILGGKMDIENTLISATQNQQMVEVQFRKETDRDWATREVAPYDIYDTQDKDGRRRGVLLGYCWEHKGYKAAPIRVYLDTIDNVRLLNKKFDGFEVRNLIKPRKLPNIPRNW